MPGDRPGYHLQYSGDSHQLPFRCRLYTPDTPIAQHGCCLIIERHHPWRQLQQAFPGLKGNIGNRVHSVCSASAIELVQLIPGRTGSLPDQASAGCQLLHSLKRVTGRIGRQHERQPMPVVEQQTARLPGEMTAMGRLPACRTGLSLPAAARSAETPRRIIAELLGKPRTQRTYTHINISAEKSRAGFAIYDNYAPVHNCCAAFLRSFHHLHQFKTGTLEPFVSWLVEPRQTPFSPTNSQIMIHPAAKERPGIHNSTVPSDISFSLLCSVF